MSLSLTILQYLNNLYEIMSVETQCNGGTRYQIFWHGDVVALYLLEHIKSPIQMPPSIVYDDVRAVVDNIWLCTPILQHLPKHLRILLPFPPPPFSYDLA